LKAAVSGSGDATVTTSASGEAHTGSATGEGIVTSGVESVTVGADGQSTTVTGEITSTTAESTEATPAAETDLETGELNEASFLSFEEWKKQTLDKEGKGKDAVGSKKSGDGSGKKKEGEGIQNHLENYGEEGEIEVDFGAYRSQGQREENTQASESGEAEAEETTEVEPKKPEYRRGDAGKTCKERFSYASFDAGATILKTHAGAKNAKAVLIENKDSYMLSECSVENKFIIIELSVRILFRRFVVAVLIGLTGRYLDRHARPSELRILL